MALEAFINGDKQKAAKKRRRTLRFELELARPTEETTNEFSFTELVERAQRKAAGPPKDGDAAEKTEDNQLAALARRFEEKYGAPTPKKRKKRVFEADLIDRGYGYDINDSFVDDSEMYEDYVPPQVDTQLGGFYVNTGNLEFKEVREAEDDDMDFTMRKKKKPKMKKQSSHQTPQSLLASLKLKKAKQHVAAQKVPKSKASKTLFKAPSLTSASSLSSSPFGKSALKKSTVKKIADTVKHAAPSASPNVNVATLLATSAAAGIADGDSSKVSVGTTTLSAVGLQSLKSGEQQVKKPGEGPDTPKPPPTLPENLPEELAANIKLFEESVARDQASTPDGKISVKIRCSYDEQLTELELECRALPMKKRSAVLEYVSHKLGVARATSIKRIKQILRKREEEALTLPLQKLKEAVDASMPEQLQVYEQELKARAESLSAGDKLPVAQLDVEEETADEVFEESTSQTADAKDSAKAKRAPRKKYKWNEEIRHLVCQVVRVKVESEEAMRGRPNGEEVLLEFLDTKVKPLWPKGWMQKGVLYKMTEAVHKHFTNPQSKKATPSAKKEKEKTGEQKRELQTVPSPSQAASSSSSVTPRHVVSVLKKAEPQALCAQVERARASTTSPRAKEKVEQVPSPRAKEKAEQVQWAVTSRGTSNGSPVTVLTKTVPTAASAVSSTSKDAAAVVEGSSLQITPRMAELLSSVASSQALVKPSTKTASIMASKASSSTSSKSLPSQKSDKLHKLTLQSKDVLSLLSQMQSSSQQIVISEASAQMQSVIAGSGSQSPTLSLHPQPAALQQGKLPSANKLSSSRSKITTSPIQMKAVVSQLKPKASSQVQLTASAPKPEATPLKITTTQLKPSLVQPKFSSAGAQIRTGTLSKVKKSSILSSAGPALKLPKLSQASSLAVTSKTVSKSSMMSGNASPMPETGSSFYSFSAPPVTTGKPQVIMQTTTKKVSPSKSKATTAASTANHPPSPTTRRPDHSSSKRNRVHSTSPLSSARSSSSPSSSHSSSPPSSAVVQHRASPTPQSTTLPPPTAGPPPLLATSALSGASLYTSTALDGTPITTILLQQQPTTTSAMAFATKPAVHVMNPRNKSVTTSSVAPESVLGPIAVTTLPLSSSASTFILPLPHFTQYTSSSPPTHTTPPLTLSSHHQTHPPPRPLKISPPPRSLTISPPTIPMAGAQVLVGGFSGTGIRSPVEQIYQEHSYGGQANSDSVSGRMDISSTQASASSSERNANLSNRMPPQ